MAYRIEYDNNTQKFEVTDSKPFRFPIFLLICILLFFVLTSAIWPEGKALIDEMLIPGDNAVTIAALNTMTNELRAGTSFDNAIYTFCCEIINGAKNTN